MKTLALLICALFCPAIAAAQDAKPPQAKTTADTKIATNVLKAHLKPLTAEEIATEVDAWIAIFQKKVQEITNEDIKSLTGPAAEKTSALDAINKLRTELTDIDDRVQTVLAAWQAKGAEEDEVKAKKLYVATAAGVDTGLDIQKIWAYVSGWIMSENGGIRLGINALLFLITLFVFKILSGIAGKIMAKVVGRMKAASDLLRTFCVNFVKKFTSFIGLIVALTMLGVDVGPFLAVIGAAGFIIGFALQGTLNNFAAGIMILIYRPFDLNHVVEVAGVTGKVDAMSMSATTVKTPDNQVIIIPNGNIWGGIIKNVTGSTTRRVDLVFGIGYDDDIAKAQAILEDLVNGHELVLQDPAPIVKLHELADSSVNFVCRPWSKTSDYWDVYWDLTRAVKERFDAAGISIPYPQTDVHVHQVAAGS
jgi:small conductance mechanosensitive channel